MSRTTIALLVVGFVVLVSVASVWFWDALPGTFYRDDHGVPHGSGRHVYKYKSGATMLVEDYFRGKGIRSEWFKPDGTSIRVTNWNNESGVGLYLRDDGSIRTQMTYVQGVADGPATYYDERGNILGEAIFKDGSRISGYDPKAAPKE